MRRNTDEVRHVPRPTSNSPRAFGFISKFLLENMRPSRVFWWLPNNLTSTTKGVSSTISVTRSLFGFLTAAVVEALTDVTLFWPELCWFCTELVLGLPVDMVDHVKRLELTRSEWSLVVFREFSVAFVRFWVFREKKKWLLFLSVAWLFKALEYLSKKN